MTDRHPTRINFVSAAAPKGKRKGPYSVATEVIKKYQTKAEKFRSFLSKVNPFQRRKRKKFNKKGGPRHEKVWHFIPRLLTDDECEAKYFQKDWKEEEASQLFESFCAPESDTISVEDFHVYDNFNKRVHDSTKHLLVFDEDTGQFMFGKVAPRQCTHSLGPIKYWNGIRRLLKNVMQLKPNIGRGDGRSGFNDAYKLYGFRKDPKGNEVTPYAFKGKAKSKEQEEERKENNETVAHLCSGMEEAASTITHDLEEEAAFDEIKDIIDLPTFVDAGKATAFSIGRRYMSKCHQDCDYYLTTLSALSGRSLDHDKILYYFVFPTHKALVPIRSGEIIVFNPLMWHSCTNPRFNESYIFSAYVSAKTVLTHTSASISTGSIK